MVMKSLTIASDVLYAKGVFPAVIAAIADGRIDKKILESIITARVPLEDVEHKGIGELISNKANHIKILIKVAQ
jgi:threonine dehydrogenase-like Zn-dependent dehydrogenase